MPGRLVGQTTDVNGKRGFVLTLATREQHIRREKATSNICTNQALVALMVNIFMTIYGKVGLRELAKQNLAKAAYAADQFSKHAKVLFAGAPRFNEFVVQTSEDPYAINSRLAGAQDRRRISAEEVLSRTGQCGAVVLHGDDHAHEHRHRGWLRRRQRALGAGHERNGRGGGDAMKSMTRKATRHVNQNEGLIFEKSSPGKAAWKLPPLDVPEVDTAELLGQRKKDLGNMPEVSEIEIIRHFTRLSTWNYAIDLGMYPLGSCTMKYNPRVNEVVVAARRPGQRASLSAGEEFRRARCAS